MLIDWNMFLLKKWIQLKSFILANLLIKKIIMLGSKTDGFIRVDDRTRYSVLFGLEKYEAIYKELDTL